MPAQQDLGRTCVAEKFGESSIKPAQQALGRNCIGEKVGESSLVYAQQDPGSASTNMDDNIVLGRGLEIDFLSGNSVVQSDVGLGGGNQSTSNAEIEPVEVDNINIIPGGDDSGTAQVDEDIEEVKAVDNEVAKLGF